MCWREAGSAGAGWCFYLSGRPNSAAAAGELFLETYCLPNVRGAAAASAAGRAAPAGRWSWGAVSGSWVNCRGRREEGFLGALGAVVRKSICRKGRNVEVGRYRC